MRARLTLVLLVEIALLAYFAVQLAVGPATAAPPPEAGDVDRGRAPTPDAIAPTATANATASAAPTPAPASARTELRAAADPADPVGVVLAGSIRWRDGRSATASVTLRSGDLQRAASGTGHYATTGLAPGEWELQVRGNGVVERTTQITLTDAAVQSHDVVLDPTYALRVAIRTPDGSDASRAVRTAGVGGLPVVAQFHVVAQRDRIPERLAPSTPSVLLIGDARWQPDRNSVGGFAGTLNLAAAPPAHVALLLRSHVVAQQVVQPGQTELTFVVDPVALAAIGTTVRVRIVDAATGAPLPDARFGLGTSNGGGPGGTTDADGRITLTGVAPGLYRAMTTAKDRESLHTIVRVATDPIDLGEFRLGAPLPLKGRVVDAEGRPVAAEVRWTELKWRPTPAEFAMYRSTRTDADGAFTIGVGRGRIALYAESERSVAVGVFDNPPTAPIELRVASAVRVDITRPDDPTRTFTVTIHDARRDPVAACTLDPGRQRMSVHLPPGEYTFEVHDADDRLVTSGPLRLDAKTATVTIR